MSVGEAAVAGGATSDDGSRRISGRRLALWAAIAVVGVDLLFFTGASNFGTAAQARILNQAIFVVAAVGLAMAVLRGSATLKSPMVVPIIAWVAALAIATAASQRPESSREGLALLLLAVPGYFTVRAITWTPWLRRRVDGLLVVATMSFLVAYLLQAGTQWLSFWSVAGLRVPPLRPGDVGLTVGTVNAVALYIELLVPLAAWLAWSVFGRHRLGATIAVLGLVALVVTGSRGAWLGAGVSALLVGLVAWLRAGRPLPFKTRTARLAAVGFAAAILVVVVLAFPILVDRLLAGDAGRLELWTAAWAMFTSSPLTGTGPGSYPQLRPLSPVSDANLAVLTTSHSSPLQTLTDGGLLLFAAAVLTLIVVAVLVARALRADEGARRGLALAVSAGLLSMFVHSLVDTQTHIIAVVLMLYLLVSRLDPPAPAISPAREQRPLLAGAALVVLGIVLMVPIDLAGIQAQLGNAALDRGDVATAARQFDAAVRLHDIGPYRLGQGIAAASLGDQAGAADALGRAADTTPLTFLQAAAAGVASATERARLIAAIDAAGPYDAAASLNVAWLRFEDAPDVAVGDLADAMTTVPSLIYSTRPDGVFDDPTWEEARHLAFDRVAQGDPLRACVVATLAGWAAESAAACDVAAEGPHAEALDLLAEAVATRSIDAELARALIRANPMDPALLGVLWDAGFAGRSQPVLDAVRAVSVPVLFNTPAPPMEVVVDGRADADYSWRIPRWPMASDGRNPPKRPYPPGMLTIEPVFRPQ